MRAKTAATRMRITRRDHQLFKTLRALAASERDRQESGKTILDGMHLLQAYKGTPEWLIVSDSGLTRDEIARHVGNAQNLIELPDAMFEQLSVVNTPSGVMAVIDIPKATSAIAGTCVALDTVQDAGNVGSILRSAAAAGVKHAVIGKGSARAWSPRVLRAGMGAHFALTIHDGVELTEALRDYSGAILTTEANALASIYATDLRGDVTWLFGNEGAGVSATARTIATGSVSIPMSTSTESLNVAAAAAVCLFEQLRQRTL
jgi:TrmH family RNA methyltransferase